MNIRCFKTVIFSSIVPILSGSMLFSCTKTSEIKYDYSAIWQEKGLVVYEPDYKKYEETSISLDESLSTYLANDNINEMIANDTIYTLSREYKGNPSLMWEYTSGVFCPVKKKLTYTINIKEATHNLMICQLEIINMPYHAIQCTDADNIHVAFLPKNIQYVDKNFVIQPEFWLNSEWLIYLSTYNDEGEFVRKYEFSWKTFLPDTQDILLDYIQFTAIYPHFYDGVEVQ